MVKFLLIGDLHGQMPLLHFKNVDAIIAPGDFCSDAAKKYMFEAIRMHQKDPKSKVKWYDIVGIKKAKEMAKVSLRDGRNVLEFLNKQNVPVFVVPGNWDWARVDADRGPFAKDEFPVLIKGLKNIHNLHDTSSNFKGIGLIGYGLSSFPEFPQSAKERKLHTAKELKKAKQEYEKKLKKLDVLFSKAKGPVLFLSHNVPYNTPLDLITWKESPRFGQHFGSVVARKVIEKHQPLVCIGAHMHEHFTSCKIGKTVCINAGFGPKVNVLLEIKNGKIKEVKFYPKEY